LKLAASSFYTPRRNPHEEHFCKGIDIRGVVAFNHGGIAENAGSI
jgi:hypothetical protein